MKSITNLLIIFFLLLKLSTAIAQTTSTTVWNRIEKYSDKNLPSRATNSEYPIGLGTDLDNPIFNDCIALKFNIPQDVIKRIKDAPNVKFTLFAISHENSFDSTRSYFSLNLTYKNGQFVFSIDKGNDFLTFCQLNTTISYEIRDLLIPNTATSKQYFGLLLSDYGAILWQNATETGINIRTAPLLFGYPAGTAEFTTYGVIDYLRYSTFSANYKIKIDNNFVEDFVLRKPKSSFDTLAAMILKNTDNPILNQRLSEEGTSDEETVSIDELSANIKLYPNPSNGQFRIDLQMTEPGNVNYEIFNMNGQKVFEQQQVEFFQGSTTHHLDTQNILTSGVYFLNVTAPNFSQKVRLIIK